MNNEAKNLRADSDKLEEEADYVEWLADPLILLTKALHNLYCKYNHTDGCSFRYEEGWKRVIATDENCHSAHAIWYKKAFAVHALLNGTLKKLAQKIEGYPFESQGGDLKLCIDWQTLKVFLES